eukprot:scaffold327_cov257-Pinguiococcus_pyrenoidosus.AAC.26
MSLLASAMAAKSGRILANSVSLFARQKWISGCPFAAGEAMRLSTSLTSLCLYLSASPGSVAFALWRDINSVTVVGGTHGNEFNGVWCVKRWRHGAASDDSCSAAALQLEKAFPSMSVRTMIGNPKAYALNRRFLDDDLNRMFKDVSLERRISEVDDDVLAYEENRARAISEVPRTREY